MQWLQLSSTGMHIYLLHGLADLMHWGSGKMMINLSIGQLCSWDRWMLGLWLLRHVWQEGDAEWALEEAICRYEQKHCWAFHTPLYKELEVVVKYFEEDELLGRSDWKVVTPVKFPTSEEEYFAILMSGSIITWSKHWKPYRTVTRVKRERMWGWTATLTFDWTTDQGRWRVLEAEW